MILKLSRAVSEFFDLLTMIIYNVESATFE